MNKKKILIVEDKREARQLIKDILNKANYNVIESKTADHGILTAINDMPDLVLMDIRVPYKTRGIGAAKTIRANEKTKHIPIIFVTAYPIWEGTEEVKNISNCGYITKPFEIDNFLKCVEKFLTPGIDDYCDPGE